MDQCKPLKGGNNTRWPPEPETPEEQPAGKGRSPHTVCSYCTGAITYRWVKPPQYRAW